MLLSLPLLVKLAVTSRPDCSDRRLLTSSASSSFFVMLPFHP